MSCATNLAFALEIYIKTLFAQLELQIPRGHDLGKLYEGLPPAVKSKIEETYDTLRRSLPAGTESAFTIAKGPRKTPEWESHRSKGLGELLTKSGPLFSEWRYIFEFKPSPDNDYEFHQFEYRLLLLACEALKAAIQAGTEEVPRDR